MHSTVCSSLFIIISFNVELQPNFDFMKKSPSDQFATRFTQGWMSGSYKAFLFVYAVYLNSKFLQQRWKTTSSFKVLDKEWGSVACAVCSFVWTWHAESWSFGSPCFRASLKAVIAVTHLPVEMHSVQPPSLNSCIRLTRLIIPPLKCITLKERRTQRNTDWLIVVCVCSDLSRPSIRRKWDRMIVMSQHD